MSSSHKITVKKVIDEEVEITFPFTRQDSSFIYHVDEQGTIVQVSRDLSGKIVMSIKHAPGCYGYDQELSAVFHKDPVAYSDFEYIFQRFKEIL